MKIPDTDFINALRERYPAGSRITLNHMNDPYHPVEPGTNGTLKHIDDMGTFHVSWDNGRTLGLIYGEDSFSITPPVSIQKQDRYRYVSELSEEDRKALLARLETSLRESGMSGPETALAAAQASRVVDLEDTIQIHYREKEETLDAVHADSRHPSLFHKIVDAEGKRGDATPPPTTPKETPDR